MDKFVSRKRKTTKKIDETESKKPKTETDTSNGTGKKELWATVGEVKFRLKDTTPGLTYLENFMSAEWADAFFKYFVHEIKWQHTEIYVGGKWQLEPRWTAAFSKFGSTYTYNRKTVKGLPYTRMLWILDLLIKKVYGLNTSFLFFNHYRDENDRIGDHPDDETDLDPSFPIVSGSHGATRVMQIKEFRKKQDKQSSQSKKERAPPRKILAEIVMLHGSCSVMFPPLHHEVTHGVPTPRKHHPPATATIDGKPTTIRINWTARCLKSDRGKDDKQFIPQDLLELNDIRDVKL